eukprot:CAMPEP_0115014464 /NCGR_PEP_ID=MMETSP0216-20121206/26096_1 /TAXON_ID=223996 /ORGANISM="Protocruzia adherens, Strain Boccale" /LENGTH=830 /DNA_ID=CAMNT_0002384213 /DNA_START=88 /DNA_END=2580 /DNA_ORIENTATION=-
MSHLQAAGMRSLGNAGSAAGFSDPKTFNPITGQQGNYYYANMRNRSLDPNRSSGQLPTDATPAEKKAHLQKVMESGDTFSYFGREGGGAPIYGRHPVRRGVLQDSREFPVSKPTGGINTAAAMINVDPVIQETKSVPNLQINTETIPTRSFVTHVPNIEVRSPVQTQSFVEPTVVYNTDPKPAIQEIGRMVVTPRNDLPQASSTVITRQVLDDTEQFQKQVRQDEYKRFLELQVEQRKMEKEREKHQKLLEEQREQERLRREQQELEEQYRREQEEKQRKLDAMREQNLKLYEQAQIAQAEADALKKQKLHHHRADVKDNDVENQATIKPQRGRRVRDDSDVHEAQPRMDSRRNKSVMDRQTTNAPGNNFDKQINDIRSEFNEGQKELSSQIKELMEETRKQRAEAAKAKMETKEMMENARTVPEIQEVKYEPRRDTNPQIDTTKTTQRIVLREVATQFDENDNLLHDQSVQAMSVTEVNRSANKDGTANAGCNTSGLDLYEPRIIQTNTHFVPIVDPNAKNEEVKENDGKPNVMFTSNSKSVTHIENIMTPRAPRSKANTTFQNKFRKISSVKTKKRTFDEDGAMTERSNVRRNISSAGEASELDIDDFQHDFDIAYIYNKNRQRFKHLRTAPKEKSTEGNGEVRNFVKGYLEREAEGEFSVIEDKNLARMMRNKRYHKASAREVGGVETSIIHEIPQKDDYNQFNEESVETEADDERERFAASGSYDASISENRYQLTVKNREEQHVGPTSGGCRILSPASDSLTDVSQDSFIRTVNRKLGEHSDSSIQTPRYARFKERDINITSSTEEIPYGDTRISDPTLSSMQYV